MPESSSNSFGSPLPVFRVKNVEASIAYYLDALGFELRWRAPVREKSIAPTGSPAANRLAFPHQACNLRRNFLSVCRI